MHFTKRILFPTLLWGSALGFLLAVLFHRMGLLAPIASLIFALFLLAGVIPTAIVAGIVGWRLERRWAKRITYWSIAFGLFAVVQLVSTFTIAAFAPNHPRKVRAQCEQLLPYLDAYQTTLGNYPHTLTALDEFSPLPNSIPLSRCQYSGDDQRFSLIVSDFWIGYWAYDIDSQQWLYFD